MVWHNTPDIKSFCKLHVRPSFKKGFEFWVALPEVLLGQNLKFGLIFNGHLALGRWLFRLCSILRCWACKIRTEKGCEAEAWPKRWPPDCYRCLFGFLPCWPANTCWPDREPLFSGDWDSGVRLSCGSFFLGGPLMHHTHTPRH